MALSTPLSVDANGAANITVPLILLPGTAGAVPDLSLQYNSQLSNGIAGVGWSVSGLPVIGRCSRTIAQDGARGSINFDANDRFCINGQRLVAISGTYGADGTEYRSEVETFTRVISHGVAGTGPAWFEAHTKSGRTMEFGNTSDSALLVQSAATVRSWAIDKVTDAKGNYFSVSYQNDTANGQLYPSRIDYTGNGAAGLQPYASVRFVYASRPDTVAAYHNGATGKMLQRLTNLQTFSGDDLVRDYRFGYQQGTSSGNSQLTSLQVCEAQGSCQPPTTFGWEQGGTAMTVVPNVASQNGSLIGYRPYLGDFNGDGKVDVLWDSSSSTSAPTSSGNRVLWTSGGDGTFTVTTNVAGQDGTLTGYTPLIGDFTADGLSDIWWYKLGASSSYQTSRWTGLGGGSFAPASGPTINLYAIPPVFVGDVDGDGRADVIWETFAIDEPDPLTFTSAQITFTQPDGTVVKYPTEWNDPNDRCTFNNQFIAGSAWRYYHGGDFDGDGLPDLLRQGIEGNTTFYFRCSATSNRSKPFTFQQWLSAGSVWLDAPVQSANYEADFNGDGLTDLLVDNVDLNGRSAGTRVLWLSTGGGFVKFTNPSSLDGSLVGYRPLPGDFNGDGRADILWDQVDTNGLSTGTRVLWLSKGDGTFQVISNFASQNGTLVGYMPILGDFNGDGKADVLWDSRSGADTRSTGTRVLWLSDGGSVDHITSVTSGLGGTSEITYGRLTDPVIYSKDTTGAYPLLNLANPTRVAAQISVPDGIGGSSTTTYRYAGSKSDITGRALGFRQIVATNQTTGIVDTLTYRQDFPYIGLIATEVRSKAGVTLNSVSNTYQDVTLSGGRHLPLVAQRVESGADLDGTALPTTTTSYQYDAYGNPTAVTTSKSDGYVHVANQTFANDTTHWLLGELTATTVANTVPQSGLPPPLPTCDLPWGGSISSGQSVTAYSAATTGSGQSCSALSETRTCTNGILSGSFTNQSCTAAACSLPWGGSIASGQGVTAYSAASPPSGQSCAAISETRTCTSGLLSGSYTQQSCSTTAACPLPWGGSIASGQGVTAYSAATSGPGQTCSALSETRSCSDGTLSGSFTQQSCAEGMASCTVPAGTTWTVSGATCTVPSTFSINHGATSTVSDTTAPTTGSATYACSNGIATQQSGVTCTSAVTPGSQTYSNSGTFSFTVPAYNSLTIKAWGAGSGGYAGFYQTAGGNGGATSISQLSLVSGGGIGRTGGTATGGTTNLSGSADGSSPNGGPAPGGCGAGGYPPGGGGAGGCDTEVDGANGGGGAYLSKTYSAGQIAAGSTLTIIVGAGGAGGAGPGGWGRGGNGAPGQIVITWN